MQIMKPINVNVYQNDTVFDQYLLLMVAHLIENLYRKSIAPHMPTPPWGSYI